MAYLGSLNTLTLNDVGLVGSKISNAYESAYKNIAYNGNLLGYQITTMWDKTFTHKDITSFIGFNVKYLEFRGSGNPLTALSVLVKVENNIREGIRVILYERKSNLLVGMGNSDENGIVTFTDLDEALQYYAVAITDEDYNALIYDKLIPS